MLVASTRYCELQNDQLGLTYTRFEGLQSLHAVPFAELLVCVGNAQGAYHVIVLNPNAADVVHAQVELPCSPEYTGNQPCIAAASIRPAGKEESELVLAIGTGEILTLIKPVEQRLLQYPVTAPISCLTWYGKSLFIGQNHVGATLPAQQLDPLSCVLSDTKVTNVCWAQASQTCLVTAQTMGTHPTLTAWNRVDNRLKPCPLMAKWPLVAKAYAINTSGSRIATLTQDKRYTAPVVWARRGRRLLSTRFEASILPINALTYGPDNWLYGATENTILCWNDYGAIGHEIVVKGITAPLRCVLASSTRQFHCITQNDELVTLCDLRKQPT